NMNRKRTKNQLTPTPILIPKMRASWILRGANTPSMVGAPSRAPPRSSVSRRLGPGAAARDDGLKICAGRQRAVLQSSVAAQARGAECVGHRRRGMAHQQRALQTQRHVFDDPASACLKRLGVGEVLAQAAHT